MPSLAQLRAKTAANQAANQAAAANNPSGADNLTPTITPEHLVQIPAAAPLDLPVPMPQRGVFPPQFVFASDRSDSTRVFRGPNTRSAVFQTPVQPASAATIVAPTTAAAVVAALQILVNNQKTPNQEILNFLAMGGITISSGPNGQIIFDVAEGGTDGLTHGTLPWESDPGYVILRDDFHASLTGITNAGSPPTVGLGQLGWNLLGGSGAPSNGFVGGSGLHIGSYTWENSATAAAAGVLVLAPLNNNTAGAAHAAGSWALADSPGSVTTFVFKTDTDISGSGPAQFSASGKALYVGLTGPAYFLNSQNTFSRPDIFIGVRYDTSPTIGPLTVTSVAAGTGAYTGTFPLAGGNNYAGFYFQIAGFANAANNGYFVCTSSTTTVLTLANVNSVLEAHAATATRPGLNDSFYTLEVVANPTRQQVGRNNAQGATLVTNVAPTVGGWHRVDIYFNQTGEVTVTLDGSTANTLTTAVPVVSFTGTITGQVGAGGTKGLVSWTVNSANLPNSPWDTGTNITISGFTAGRSVLNGTWTLASSLTARFTFDMSATVVGGSSDTVTLSGYPVYTPLVMFGNDDTSTTVTGGSNPTAGTMAFFIDYFSFVQNSNLGPSAPGSVVATNSRYF